MVTYDPDKIALEKLLQKFWNEHNPVSRASKQYKSALWYQSEEEKQIMQKSMEEEQKKCGGKIVTTLMPLGDFYRAEEYHQNYLGK